MNYVNYTCRWIHQYNSNNYVNEWIIDRATTLHVCLWILVREHFHDFQIQKKKKKYSENLKDIKVQTTVISQKTIQVLCSTRFHNDRSFMYSREQPECMKFFCPITIIHSSYTTALNIHDPRWHFIDYYPSTNSINRGTKIICRLHREISIFFTGSLSG